MCGMHKNPEHRSSTCPSCYSNACFEVEFADDFPKDGDKIQCDKCKAIFLIVPDGLVKC